MPNTVTKFKKLYTADDTNNILTPSFTAHCFFKPSVTFWHGVPVAHAQSFQAGRDQKLLVFVPNTGKVFLIQ